MTFDWKDRKYRVVTHHRPKNPYYSNVPAFKLLMNSDDISFQAFLERAVDKLIEKLDLGLAESGQVLVAGEFAAGEPGVEPELEIPGAETHEGTEEDEEEEEGGGEQEEEFGETEDPMDMSPDP